MSKEIPKMICPYCESDVPIMDAMLNLPNAKKVSKAVKYRSALRGKEKSRDVNYYVGSCFVYYAGLGQHNFVYFYPSCHKILGISDHRYDS